MYIPPHPPRPLAALSSTPAPPPSPWGPAPPATAQQDNGSRSLVAPAATTAAAAEQSHSPVGFLVALLYKLGLPLEGQQSSVGTSALQRRDNGTNTNVTIGIVVGVLLGVFIIGVLYFMHRYRYTIRFAKRKKRHRHKSSSSKSSKASSGGGAPPAAPPPEAAPA